MEIKTNTNTQVLASKIVEALGFTKTGSAHLDASKEVAKILKEAGIPEPVKTTSKHAKCVASQALITGVGHRGIFITFDLYGPTAWLTGDTNIEAQHVLALIIDREIEAVHKKYADVLSAAKRVVEASSSLKNATRFPDPIPFLKTQLDKLTKENAE